MPWGATHTQKKTTQPTLWGPCILAPQIHRRGYKVSPVQDADLSAQPFSVKLRLRIPTLLTFSALLSVGKKKTQTSLPLAPNNGAIPAAPQVGERFQPHTWGGIILSPFPMPCCLAAIWGSAHCLSESRESFKVTAGCSSQPSLIFWSQTS